MLCEIRRSCKVARNSTWKVLLHLHKCTRNVFLFSCSQIVLLFLSSFPDRCVRQRGPKTVSCPSSQIVATLFLFPFSVSSPDKLPRPSNNHGAQAASSFESTMNCYALTVGVTVICYALTGVASGQIASPCVLRLRDWRPDSVSTGLITFGLKCYLQVSGHMPTPVKVTQIIPFGMGLIAE